MKDNDSDDSPFRCSLHYQWVNLIKSFVGILFLGWLIYLFLQG